jgi:hypothetical protein
MNDLSRTEIELFRASMLPIDKATIRKIRLGLIFRTKSKTAKYTQSKSNQNEDVFTKIKKAPQCGAFLYPKIRMD